MDTIRFRCPNCQQTLKVSAEKAGRKVRCNRCADVLVVPDGADSHENGEETADAGRLVTPARGARQQRVPREPDITEETPPEPEEEEDKEETPEHRRPVRKRGQQGQRWRLARMGILMLIIGSVASLLYLLGSQFLARVMLRQLTDINFYLWLTLGMLGAVAVIKLVGYVLCLFAPPESETKVFVIIALVSLLLDCAMTGFVYRYSLSFTLDSSIYTPPKYPRQTDKQSRENYQKDLEKYQQEVNEYTSKMLKNAKSQRLVFSLLQTFGALLNGVYVVSVPLLLRAFCQAMKLKELEPSCDTLLKISAGILAPAVLTRLLGLVLIHLLIALSWFGMLLSLAWEGLALLLLIQIWMAVPSALRLYFPA